MFLEPRSVKALADKLLVTRRETVAPELRA